MEEAPDPESPVQNWLEAQEALRPSWACEYCLRQTCWISRPIALDALPFGLLWEPTDAVRNIDLQVSDEGIRWRWNAIVAEHFHVVSRWYPTGAQHPPREPIAWTQQLRNRQRRVTMRRPD